MKLLKLITYGLVAVALLSSAKAANLYLTGSTAFRSSAHTAITHIFDAGTLKFAYIDNAAGTATASNSSAAIYVGKIGGSAITIETHWSGSEAGVQAVAGGFTVTFLPSNATVSSTGTKLPANTALTTVAVPDVAMSDAFQASSRFKAGATIGNPPFGSYQNLNSTATTTGIGQPGQIVGIIGFTFVASDDAPASANNFTSQNARALFSTGRIPLSNLTGSSVDRTKHIYATGRDIDSGTRLTTMAETGLGSLAVVKQYEPIKNGALAVTNGTGTGGDGVAVSSFTIWPAGSIDGVPEVTGNGGYSSGGTIALALANHTPANTFLVSYLGVNDAANAVSLGAHQLAFNGNTYSVSGVAEGDYTFWGYEHLYYRNNTATPTKATADKLALQLYNTDAPLPHYTDMAVTRTTDGATVLPKF
jgi:hypothetical protein